MEETYLEGLLGFQDFCKSCRGLDSDGVTVEAHLLNALELAQSLDVRLDISGGVKLERLPLKGKDLVVCWHFGCRFVR